MVSNVYEITHKGEKIGFKCGSLAIAIACREAKCKTIQDLIVRMAEQDLLAILALFYGSACQYYINKGQEVNISMDSVSDWIEEMGDDNAKKATEIMLQSFVPKKAKPPKRGAK